MIYAEVLEVPDVQTAKVPSKPTISNLLRHSRSEENIVEAECGSNNNNAGDKVDSLIESHPSSSSSHSNIPKIASSGDLQSNSDCWSQEDDEISLQVSYYQEDLVVSNSCKTMYCDL